jgi:hypothetical protein
MRSSLPLAALFLLAPAVQTDNVADAKAVIEKAVKAHDHKPGDKGHAVT